MSTASISHAAIQQATLVVLGFTIGLMMHDVLLDAMRVSPGNSQCQIEDCRPCETDEPLQRGSDQVYIPLASPSTDNDPHPDSSPRMRSKTHH